MSVVEPIIIATICAVFIIMFLVIFILAFKKNYKRKKLAEKDMEPDERTALKQGPGMIAPDPGKRKKSTGEDGGQREKEKDAEKGEGASGAGGEVGQEGAMGEREESGERGRGREGESASHQSKEDDYKTGDNTGQPSSKKENANMSYDAGGNSLGSSRDGIYHLNGGGGGGTAHKQSTSTARPILNRKPSAAETISVSDLSKSYQTKRISEDIDLDSHKDREEEKSYRVSEQNEKTH